MKELVVISGKGGTGKTSLTASLVALSGQSVIADCDVDAADLHILLAPQVRERHDFYSGNEAVIAQEKCSGCGQCVTLCRFGAITADRASRFTVDPVACEGCGVCVRFCPTGAIEFPDRYCGEWMISDTKRGPMVHARLSAAAENSGKLVSTVRKEARRIAEEQNRPLIIVDGPPGIGCPVIASVTGSSLVLIVTEPTVSGEHDLARALSLSKHFRIPTAVCVNKWDINPEMAQRIEEHAKKEGAFIAGRIRYDGAVTTAQIEGKPVVETDAPCVEDIKIIWEQMEKILQG